MDCRVTDGRIEPLRYRISAGSAGVSPAPDSIPWPTDDQGLLLAYSDAERDAILARLKALGLSGKLTAEAQPDPAILAACQGKVRTRSEALSALVAGKPPVTLEAVAADVAALKLAKPVAGGV